MKRALVLSFVVASACSDMPQPTETAKRSAVEGTVTSRIWLHTSAGALYSGAVSTDLRIADVNGKRSHSTNGRVRVIDAPATDTQVPGLPPQVAAFDPASGVGLNQRVRKMQVTRGETFRLRDGTRIRMQWGTDRPGNEPPPYLLVSKNDQLSAIYRFKRSYRGGQWKADEVIASYLDTGSGRVKATIQTDVRGLHPQRISFVEKVECRLEQVAHVALNTLGVKSLYADDGPCFWKGLEAAATHAAALLTAAGAIAAEATCLSGAIPLWTCPAWLSAIAATAIAEALALSAAVEYMQCMNQIRATTSWVGGGGGDDPTLLDAPPCQVTILEETNDGGLTWSLLAVSVTCP